MKTDRELLELAAKADGLNIKGEWVDSDDTFTHLNVGKKFTSERIKWNPLADDGDAFRLAVQLGLWIHIGKYHTAIEGTHIEETARRSDSLAATRRAIVRAAAEIQLQREKA